MKEIEINNITYLIVKDEEDSINLEEVKELLTDYFLEFDYILGDYSYSKLRLKGFYDKDNKNMKHYNNYNKINSYLKDYCAPGCRHFVLQLKK